MASKTQSEIVELLNTNFTKQELVQTLQDILKISKPTAYKYLSQDVPISYDQMSKILDCEKFQTVLLRSGSTSQSNITWNYPVFDRPVTDALSYVQSINNFIKLFSGNDVEIKYTSYEVPLFYYMYYPRLFAFKLFCWSKTIWKTPGFENAHFDENKVLTPEVLEIMEDTLNRFSQLKSTEYWTDQLFDNTIRQIHYFRQMEYFDNIKVCKQLAQDILNLIRLMRVMATTGKKMSKDKSTHASDITIYRNDIYFTNNIVSVHSPEQIITFCAFDNPNYIITMDPKLGERTSEWLENMQSGCTRLTQNSELVRLGFFRTMEEALDLLGFDLST
ncbi:MAG: hypothetical protein IPO45_11915 [Saprospiraceae bacterium]|jgi:hypothetical protein|uniref:hypothetical protein n=1 Tax=Candidatus Brachybacter algidus TaxID=2982024 RepID=UPI001B7862D1|nr:hypothetical protein [Candidatus Brachybacter algidus]MBP7306906.1 hypothetical protein [Saprospiraceae bacterium]MBK6373850.1 hypothetical protein [Candidatus Brachybacter algidus]MBK6449012.1 hypothetical protein [Candidatus Brachybacter algidus]MBK7601975.1 hypothetical protein [Candidatus Brachybacter algidus]MBK8355612.1 hypothetical protein [Candidatus Brachybacter algidus]